MLYNNSLSVGKFLLPGYSTCRNHKITSIALVGGSLIACGVFYIVKNSKSISDIQQNFFQKIYKIYDSYFGVKKPLKKLSESEVEDFEKKASSLKSKVICDEKSHPIEDQAEPGSYGQRPVLPEFHRYYPEMNDWMRIKTEELTETQKQECLCFLSGNLHVKQLEEAAYLSIIVDVFRSQVLTKMVGMLENSKRYSLSPIIESRVYQLVRHFLKGKCGCQTPLHPQLIEEGKKLAERAKFDPHFHMNSFYVPLNRTSLSLLPNFNLAYPMINPSANRFDREVNLKDFLKKQLEMPDTPSITEAQSFQPEQLHALIQDAGLQNRLRVIAGHYRTWSAPLSLSAVVRGYDICGVERRDYASLCPFLKAIHGSNKFLRVHMGETIDPEDGKQHIDKFLEETTNFPNQLLRIGHGTHASIEAMKEIARRGYFVEACLSSNKKTGILEKRHHYPLSLMLLLGVKVVIGTDGGQLYSTSLSLEYTHALKSINHFLEKLNSASEEIIRTSGGEALLYKHIRDLLCPSCSQPDAKEVRFVDLKSWLRPEILQRISSVTLIENVNELLVRCYPPEN